MELCCRCQPHWKSLQRFPNPSSWLYGALQQERDAEEREKRRESGRGERERKGRNSAMVKGDRGL